MKAWQAKAPKKRHETNKMRSAPRFPPSWTIDEANDACLIVKDHSGHAPVH